MTPSPPLTPGSHYPFSSRGAGILKEKHREVRRELSLSHCLFGKERDHDMWGQNKTMGWGTGVRGHGWKWGEGKLEVGRLERGVIELRALRTLRAMRRQ